MSMNQLEKHIASDLIHEEEAKCEIRWEGEECPNSVAWTILGHDFKSHQYEWGVCCDPCYRKAQAKGFMVFFLACNDCHQGPIIKESRPI